VTWRRPPAVTPAAGLAARVCSGGCGPSVTGSITSTLIEGDALTVDADVLALKHGQRLHGVDRQVASRLSRAGVAIADPLVAPGDHVLLESMGLLRAPRVLFLGTPPLDDFGYHEIRRLSRDTLGTLARIAPTTRSVAMTLHGPGSDLDEVEAALAQLGGCRDALYGGDLGADLERISIVEHNARRYERVGAALERQLSDTPDATRLPADRFSWRLTARRSPHAGSLPSVERTQGSPTSRTPSWRCRSRARWTTSSTTASRCRCAATGSSSSASTRRRSPARS